MSRMRKSGGEPVRAAGVPDANVPGSGTLDGSRISGPTSGAGAAANGGGRNRTCVTDCPVSRGLRNRNPGNIRRSATRYRGEVRPSGDSAFKRFESLAWGYRAIFVLLHTYRVRHGLTTPAQMIARWAPPAENDTAGYIRAVCGQTGIAPDRGIDTRDPALMIPLAAAISRVENGLEADLREVRAGWALFERFAP